jgi:hypothetical protein
MTTRFSGITFNEALQLFANSHHACEPFDLYRGLDFSNTQEGDVLTVTQACIHAMYYTHTFSINALKCLFLFNDKPLAVCPSTCTLGGMVAQWVKNVGPVEHTMHWACEELFSFVFKLMKMPLPELETQLKFRSQLDSMTNGVMEVMFVASCLEFEMVKEMGSLFWVFTRALVTLDVSSGDQLNLLLWENVLPQTIIQLEAKEYILDSLLPQIHTTLTIQGVEPDPSQEMQGGDSEDEDVMENKSTVLMVHGQAVLTFTGNVRIYHVTIQHLSSDAVRDSNSVVSFYAAADTPCTVFMNNVAIVNNGCSVVNYTNAHFNNCSITSAVYGFLLFNIEKVYIMGTGDLGAVEPKKVGVFSSQTAICARDIRSLMLRRQIFFQNDVVFDSRVSSSCILENVAIVDCTHMGEMLSSAKCTLTFIDVVVSFFVCFSYFIFCDFLPFENRRVVGFPLCWRTGNFAAKVLAKCTPLFPRSASRAHLSLIPPKKLETFQKSKPWSVGGSFSLLFWCFALRWFFAQWLSSVWVSCGLCSDMLLSQMRNQQMTNGEKSASISCAFILLPFGVLSKNKYVL